MIVAVWGQNKTGKSTFALTFPEDIVVFDFDLGVDRAIGRFNGKSITVHKIEVPIRLKGLKLAGSAEAWHSFEDKFSTACSSKKVKTIVIDTGTQWYELCRFGYLQELQENKARESLQPIEYGEVYARLRRIIQNARLADKHLVLTHYARDEYGVRLNPSTGVKEDYRTGSLEMDGYKHTEGQADLVLYTFLRKVTLNSSGEKLKPVGRVCMSGIGLDLVDQELIEPSYEGIMNLVEMLNG